MTIRSGAMAFRGSPEPARHPLRTDTNSSVRPIVVIRRSSHYFSCLTYPYPRHQIPLAGTASFGADLQGYEQAVGDAARRRNCVSVECSAPMEGGQGCSSHRCRSGKTFLAVLTLACEAPRKSKPHESSSGGTSQEQRTAKLVATHSSGPLRQMPGSGHEPVVELASRGGQPVSGPRPDQVAKDRP